MLTLLVTVIILITSLILILTQLRRNIMLKKMFVTLMLASIVSSAFANKPCSGGPDDGDWGTDTIGNYPDDTPDIPDTPDAPDTTTSN